MRPLTSVEFSDSHKRGKTARSPCDAQCEACTVPLVSTADFDQLSESEKRHFYQCSRCGEMVDRRQLDGVLFHEDHVHRPDIQYGGSQSLRGEK